MMEMSYKLGSRFCKALYKKFYWTEENSSILKMDICVKMEMFNKQDSSFSL